MGTYVPLRAVRYRMRIPRCDSAKLRARSRGQWMMSVLTSCLDEMLNYMFLCVQAFTDRVTSRHVGLEGGRCSV